MDNMVNKRIAIIPARGGSKRVPKKNIIDFDGKPMLAWSIEAAKESNLFDDIVVSTDSEEIAEVAIKFGASVPALRNNSADDFTPVSEATLETLLQLEVQGKVFDEVIQLFAVCPLKTGKDIVNAHQFFTENNVPFLISCYKYVWMNPWWAIQLDENHQAKWVFEDAKKRSQDLPELYSPTGAIWIAKVEALKKSKSFYGPGHIYWEMPWYRALDIDNVEDIQLGLMLKKVDF
jgi:CMP-N-acetylneuraminic acid synthetase